MKNMQRIKIKGHNGTWSAISNRRTSDGHTLFLMEHDVHGEDTACLIIDENAELLLEDVVNGFGDYAYALASETDTEIPDSQSLTRRVMVAR
ncbi:hypothetical protein [Paenibacillus glucanolyticus]|uniref:hypothetical protein n=1 Tax=Paenibacillus glucanolyticus TaxID=59843 RepID=UPI00096C072A|nr:hypothetical protein [Paenibacillus glucanolyticus]OMF76713.1 hypothetical protein BK142_14425 [Paenibacillus glucanolyticus]